MRKKKTTKSYLADSGRAGTLVGGFLAFDGGFQILGNGNLGGFTLGARGRTGEFRVEIVKEALDARAEGLVKVVLVIFEHGVDEDTGHDAHEAAPLEHGEGLLEDVGGQANEDDILEDTAESQADTRADLDDQSQDAIEDESHAAVRKEEGPPV